MLCCVDFSVICNIIASVVLFQLPSDPYQVFFLCKLIVIHSIQPKWLVFLCLNFSSLKLMIVIKCVVFVFRNLGYNALTGSIPAALGSLPVVEQMLVIFYSRAFFLKGDVLFYNFSFSPVFSRLNYNFLSGSVPVEVASLGRLRRLSVEIPFLEVPFFRVTNYVICTISSYLDHNRLSGSIPTKIGLRISYL